MEDILAKIMKDASSTKHLTIKQSCLESQEFLANQQSLMRSPPYEMRQKCLETFRLALESKHGKLVSHSLSGFQRMIWDKSFQSVFESGIEENWFPNQLLKAVESIHLHSDDIQVDILKILLNMTSTHGQSLTSNSIITLINLCLEAFSKGSAAVKTAAQATVNQTITSFCIMLQETNADHEEESDESDEDSYNLLESVTEELYPILHYTCEKLKIGNSIQRKAGAPLILQCTLSVLKNIKVDIYQNITFLNFLWQELCPLLVAFLGSPKTDKTIISSQKVSEGSEIGRGSSCLAAAPSCHSMEAKTIYSIAIELVRLVGSVGSLRPVLESLFHRMLLYPSVQHRLEALKAVKELFSKPELLLELAAPPLYATSDKDWISLDLDLIKICIDALGECCHSSDNSICYASVSCVLALLKSLEEICGGEKMKDELITCINSQFRTLESSDYKGAKSERWLKTKLRSLIIAKEKQELLKKMNDTSPSTGASTENSADDISLNDPENVESDIKRIPEEDVNDLGPKTDCIKDDKDHFKAEEEFKMDDSDKCLKDTISEVEAIKKSSSELSFHDAEMPYDESSEKIDLHPTCMRRWMRESMTCPVCRGGIHPDDQHYFENHQEYVEANAIQSCLISYNTRNTLTERMRSTMWRAYLNQYYFDRYRYCRDAPEWTLQQCLQKLWLNLPREDVQVNAYFAGAYERIHACRRSCNIFNCMYIHKCGFKTYQNPTTIVNMD